jgi:putative FmdB family regulatory protein
MPLYEYQCDTCGVRFERRQRMSDDPIGTCPECGGDVHRLIQPVGIVFKGKGFYVTDNRAKSSTAIPGSTKKDKEPSAESDSPSTDKGDTKGETTKDD